MKILLGLFIGWLIGYTAIKSGCGIDTAFLIIAICAAAGIAGM